jgi:hypothetical protein
MSIRVGENLGLFRGYCRKAVLKRPTLRIYFEPVFSRNHNGRVFKGVEKYRKAILKCTSA